MKELEVKNIAIDVDVKGIRQLMLSSDIGGISSNVPFQPFGAIPKVGSYFIIGKEELFKKDLTDINKNAEFIEDLIFNNSEKIKVDKNDQVFSTIPATSLANIFKLDLSLRFRGVRSQYFFFKNLSCV